MKVVEDDYLDCGFRSKRCYFDKGGDCIACIKPDSSYSCSSIYRRDGISVKFEATGYGIGNMCQEEKQPQLNYPSSDSIDSLIDEFTDGLNVEKRIKEAVAFGYQEGLYKMLEIWKESNNNSK